MRKTIFATTLLLTAAGLLPAETIDPFYSSSYNETSLGGISGLPTSYGGLIFKAGDPNTLLIGGSANSAVGQIYSVPVLRDADNHITGFGSATVYSDGAFNDGGLAYAPNGTLLYSRYPTNEIGEIKPGSTETDKILSLTPLGFSSSTGALNFVPAGFNGAGGFKVLIYNTGDLYDVSLTPDGDGTYDIASSTKVTTIAGSPEGFVYVPAGSPLFSAQSMLVAEYGIGKIASYEVDSDGNPIVSTRRDFITGLSGAEGSVIDPLTGDFLFSTFGGANQVIRVSGFAAPPNPVVPEPSTWMMLGGGLIATLTVARRRRVGR